MAAKTHELRARLAKLVTQANEAEDKIAALVEDEAEEKDIEKVRADLVALDAERETVKAELAVEERKNDRLADLGSTVPDRAPVASAVGAGAVEALKLRAEDDPRRGFGNPRDFLLSVIDNSGLRDRADVADERLTPLAVMDRDDKAAAGDLAFMLPRAFTPRSLMATAGSDEQGGYADTYGGFAVPTTRLPQLLQIGFEGDPTVGMTQAIPMASPSVEIMARTDNDHTTSVSGGFTVTRRPETVAFTGSRMALEMVTLKATSLVGLAYATEEILTDSAVSFAAMIDAGFRSQFGAHLLNEKLRGLGGNEYAGVLTSAAAVTVSKETNQTADTIVYNNVIKMRARCWGYGQAVWLANHDTLPQLLTMSLAVGTGGSAVYTPSTGIDRPDMILGRPVVYSEYASSIGDLGDIMLVNWSQYLEGIYQPIQAAESMHVRFVNHERTFKLWTRNCGAPWWRAALTPNKGATLSPIVLLAAR